MWADNSKLYKEEYVLPSNEKFGWFFTFIFFSCAIYFYFNDQTKISIASLLIALLLVLSTLIRPDLLGPLNKSWNNLGILMGKVINPIVMGLIYFGLFTPIGLFTRSLDRDELRIKARAHGTYWIARLNSPDPKSFKNQY